jgi:hypothetical protein
MFLYLSSFFYVLNKKTMFISLKEVVVFARFWPTMSTFKT